jgi:hypothetical protein
MNRARVEKAQRQVAATSESLEAVKAAALREIERVRSAIEKGAPLRRLAFAAYCADSAIGRVWSESTWLAEFRRELARARAGKRSVAGPGWPNPGDVLRARAKRAARAA